MESNCSLWNLTQQSENFETTLRTFGRFVERGFYSFKYMGGRQKSRVLYLGLGVVVVVVVVGGGLGLHLTPADSVLNKTGN